MKKKARISFLFALLTLLLAACTQVHVTPTQNRVGYSACRTQVSYTHCEPLPKTGKPEIVRGAWEQHALEQIYGDSKTQTAIRPGNVETGRWYDVKLAVAGDSVKAWLDNELVFNELLKQNKHK